jgi:hypothetical protein
MTSKEIIPPNCANCSLRNGAENMRQYINCPTYIDQPTAPCTKHKKGPGRLKDRISRPARASHDVNGDGSHKVGDVSI